MSAEKKSLQQIYPKQMGIMVLIVLSALLLIAGYYFPILTIRKLWEKNTFSIMSGILSLWQDKEQILAIIIFTFSVIFPIAKLLSLCAIWFIRLTAPQRERLLYYMEILGKWSMLDVFVAALLIVSIKLGVLASADIEIGIYFFAASIFLAMIATTWQGHLVKRR